MMRVMGPKLLVYFASAIPHHPQLPLSLVIESLAYTNYSTIKTSKSVNDYFIVSTTHLGTHRSHTAPSGMGLS